MTRSAFERIYGVTVEYISGFASRDDWRKVKDLSPNLVWSVTEGDNGEDWYLSPGFHVVNMMGYVVSERPWTDSDLADLWVKW